MFATSSHLFAANYTISVNTNCSTIGGAGVPLAAADNVTIRSGAILTVDGTFLAPTSPLVPILPLARLK